MAHTRRRITSSASNPLTAEQKKKRIEAQHTEWTEEDWQYTVNYCLISFMVAQEERGNRKETINYYKRFVVKYKGFLQDVFNATAEDFPIKLITNDIHLPMLRKYLAESGNIQTVNSYLRAFRSFGNWCEEKGFVEGFKCPIKEEEPPIKEVYTDKELQILLRKPPIGFAEHFNEWRMFLIVSLILNTGARCNTILNIRIGDVELDNSYINFNVTKAHTVARLGLDKKLRVDLQQWIMWLYSRGAEDNDFLFPNEYGEQMARSTITKGMRVYCRSRGVEKTSLHLLRHTFAKKWITSGGDIVTLSKVLTHTELQMVKRYANLYGTDVKKEIEEHSALAQMKTQSGQTMRTRRPKLTDN